jgi:hypothetical protein
MGMDVWEEFLMLLALLISISKKKAEKWYVSLLPSHHTLPQVT